MKITPQPHPYKNQTFNAGKFPILENALLEFQIQTHGYYKVLEFTKPSEELLPIGAFFSRRFPTYHLHLFPTQTKGTYRFRICHEHSHYYSAWFLLSNIGLHKDIDSEDENERNLLRRRYISEGQKILKTLDWHDLRSEAYRAEQQKEWKEFEKKHGSFDWSRRSPSRFDPDEPYDDCPPLSLGIIELSLENQTLLGQTQQAWDDFQNTLEQHFPSPDFYDQIALDEARHSCEIENIYVWEDVLEKAKKVEDRSSLEEDIQEIFRCQQACTQSLHQPMSKGLLEKIVQTIKNNQDTVRENHEVYVGSQSRRIYTPPKNTQVIQDLLGNLIDFIQNADDGNHPLVKMALLHAQFEVIHPFIDGNGRTGRVLNVWYLHQQKLFEQPNVALSVAINYQRNEYYQGLKDFQAWGDTQGWITYFLKCVLESIKYSKYLLKKMGLQKDISPD